MRVLYTRISSVGQNDDRQQRVDIEKTYSDVCSGSIQFSKRPEASKLLKDIESGKIKEIQVASIDRLGRNLKDIIDTIDILTSKGICLIAEKESLRTLNDDGSTNHIAKLMVGLLGSVSEFELNRIKERQMEGIAIAKAKGQFKGRPSGTEEDKEVFLNKAKNKAIARHLKSGETIRRTALLSKASINLVRKVKEISEI